MSQDSPVAAGEDDPKGKSRGREGNRGPLTFSTQYRIALGDLNGKDVNTAISLARDRIEWKK